MLEKCLLVVALGALFHRWIDIVQDRRREVLKGQYSSSHFFILFLPQHFRHLVS